MNAATLPTVALTPGDPAGIGPDLAVMVAREPLPCRLAVIADPELIQQRARALGTEIRIDRWEGQPHCPGVVNVLAQDMAAPSRPGMPDVANAAYVLACLDCAVAGCLEHRFDAMVTGPVNKAVINDAGLAFTGHTEYLAARTRTARPVMMLIASDLRVALATAHVPLRAVPALITRDRLSEVLDIVFADLTAKFGIEEPRVGVCGLNPHAGEQGHLGSEDRDVIEPVVQDLQAAGRHVVGPLPADTLFVPEHLQAYDAVLAMYHDQGLPVLKHAGFGRAVNVTLGLPIVRTSVDHGTAYDRAGTGRANFGSLLAAIHSAIELSSSGDAG